MSNQMTEARDKYEAVVLNALYGLAKAVKHMTDTVGTVVRLPRPKLVKVTYTLTWPYHQLKSALGEEKWHFRSLLYDPLKRFDREILDLAHEKDRQHLASVIIYGQQVRPRDVHRSLRRLQAAREWCQDRAAGAEREIEEIYRQQARWDKLLTREFNLLQLGGGGPT